MGRGQSVGRDREARETTGEGGGGKKRDGCFKEISFQIEQMRWRASDVKVTALLVEEENM